jgi:tripartite-type tricarboxylate transporter receptor subunit TctC
MRTRRRLLALAGSFIAAPAGWAQSYPSRPVRIVVPFSAGGAADLLGRAVAERMSRGLGQPVIVENRPGAGTAIAAEYVAHSAPDGYTILLAGTTTLVLNPLLNPRLPYDPAHDFTGVAMLAASPMVMVVNAKSGISSVADFVRAAKAKPGSMNFGSAGNGSSLQLAGELFKTMADIDMTHVPFKGSPPALQALIGDDVQVLFDLIMTAKPLVDGGRLRPLAVTGDARSPALPNVPTLQELGFKSYDASPRYALVAPKDTSRPVIEKLNAEANAALRDRGLIAQMNAAAMDLAPGTPEAVGEFIAKERTKWAAIITARNIRLDP